MIGSVYVFSFSIPCSLELCFIYLGVNQVLYLKVNVAQLCLTLCDPMDCTVHGLLQTRILEWVAFPFSRAFSQPRDGIQRDEPRDTCLLICLILAS